MAVVFISPRQKQKMFLTGITIGVGLFLIIIASVIFLSQPKEVSVSEITFNKPKININFEIFDSDQFKSLQDFGEMKTQYSYKARKDDENVEGSISADSEDDARKVLEELGYNVYQIQEVEIGRENPFESYKSTTEE